MKSNIFVEKYEDFVTDDLLMPAEEYVTDELQVNFVPGFWELIRPFVMNHRTSLHGKIKKNIVMTLFIIVMIPGGFVNLLMSKKLVFIA